ncbi:hypothetical protein A2U14_00800 [Fusobacterium necrophorum subsp. funduliforme]|uniref:hypothetical protein n=1 Tax=Fusobacterium necrophorum TaxID=859 RepID=UPI000788D9A0|nr:hypothetical protein [Fusobacterium necrophorum]AYV92544.1 hypothetical protein BSQ88_02135 [Fusobacterium necrophorum subsp. funduliforme]KYM43509.1 hypothetical protein A2U05_04230 [Fusobacterium necrophorum subsp. funduliforme]KYM61890.1 hypothetical protein A2U14_00800 [Fusobacterium necrophorum subsp. funduliforme]KYM65489.1 hypothetical protein A2U16_03045 [Fusobacterium necrophorum subsp. funduliforme]MDK4486738.1 hypothetical protein [Fusobacterium necrophorum]
MNLPDFNVEEFKKNLKKAEKRAEESAAELSDFINTLPLTEDQKRKLCLLQIRHAEHNILFGQQRAVVILSEGINQMKEALMNEKTLSN